MPSDNIPAHKEVAVVIFSSLVFGISLVTLVHCLRWLLFVERGWKFKRHVNWPFVIAAVIITVLNALCLGLNIRSLMDRVLFISENQTGSMYQTPVWRSIVKCAASNTVALLTDATLIFRCWAIYSRSLGVVIFPIFLWFVGWACTGVQMYLQIVHIHDVTTGPSSWGPINMSVGPGIALTPFWGTTVLLNAYTSFMLIRRLYRLSQEQEVSSKQLRSIMRILAESGLLYLSITLAHFFVWFSDDGFAIRFISSLNAPVIAIAFHLIIIGVSQNTLVWRGEPVGEVSAMKFASMTSPTPDLPQHQPRQVLIITKYSTDDESELTGSSFSSQRG